jgi:hypothetical protein
LTAKQKAAFTTGGTIALSLGSVLLCIFAIRVRAILSDIEGLKNLEWYLISFFLGLRLGICAFFWALPGFACVWVGTGLLRYVRDQSRRR